MNSQDYFAKMHVLPEREGTAPRMTPANPQEQLEQFPEDWQLIVELATYAFSLANVVEKPTQIAPDGSRALHLTESVSANSEAFLIEREFAHIHNPPIGSMHATLPEPYRSLALKKGWVLRHPFAVRGIGPRAAVFIFAPRNQQELQWAKLLLEISHAWANGTIKEA
ncbi:MAG: phospholipase [Candidatus Competibacter sp.]